MKESNLNINIFRHGEALYQQKEVSIDEANDLTPQGIEDVRKNAEELIEYIKPEEEIEIWSSPIARTLQTAKIINQVLEQKGCHVRKKGSSNKYGIKIFEQLSEVKNFSWKLFYPLIHGGQVDFAGKSFFVDKNFTNPSNIDPSKYFSQDGIRHIDPIYKKTLPLEYVQAIEGFEKFIDATQRLMTPLSRLKNIKDKPYRIIIVTHDVLSGFIANIFSGGEINGIDSGEFINLERKNGKLIATKVGRLTDGNSSLDVVDEFNAKHHIST